MEHEQPAEQDTAVQGRFQGIDPGQREIDVQRDKRLREQRTPAPKPAAPGQHPGLRQHDGGENQGSAFRLEQDVHRRREGQKSRRQQQMQGAGVAFHALADVEHRAVSGQKIGGVAEGDVGIVHGFRKDGIRRAQQKHIRDHPAPGRHARAFSHGCACTLSGAAVTAALSVTGTTSVRRSPRSASRPRPQSATVPKNFIDTKSDSGPC